MSEDLQDSSYVIHAQYIKDQSFENPNAPGIFGAMKEQPPQIEINVDVSPQRLAEDTFEVALTLRVDAKVGESTAFIVELEYAAVASINQGTEEEEAQRLVFVEIPRQLFPFARAAVAGVTREGGFPPLLVNPLDFAQMHKNRLAGAAAADGAAEAEGEAEAEA